VTQRYAKDQKSQSCFIFALRGNPMSSAELTQTDPGKSASYNFSECNYMSHPRTQLVLAGVAVE